MSEPDTLAHCKRGPVRERLIVMIHRDDVISICFLWSGLSTLSAVSRAEHTGEVSSFMCVTLRLLGRVYVYTSRLGLFFLSPGNVRPCLRPQAYRLTVECYSSALKDCQLCLSLLLLRHKVQVRWGKLRAKWNGGMLTRRPGERPADQNVWSPHSTLSQWPLKGCHNDCAPAMPQRLVCLIKTKRGLTREWGKDFEVFF